MAAVTSARKALSTCSSVLCVLTLPLELLGGEDLGQAVARRVLVVSVDEERDEVALARLLLLLGLLERLHIGRVGLVVSEHIDDVGYGDLRMTFIPPFRSRPRPICVSEHF